MSRRVAVILACLVLGSLVVGVALVNPRHGNADTTFVVNSTLDAVDADLLDNACDSDLEEAGDQCTLRAAVQQANSLDGADTIELPAGSYVLKIPVTNRTQGAGGGGPDTGSAGDLDIMSDLTIQGAGAADTIIDSALLDRVIDIATPNFLGVISVSLSGLTVRNGDAPGSSGGGLHAEGGPGSIVTITSVVITDNSANYGGGINIERSVSVMITNSTIENNDAVTDGGGVRVDGQAAVVIDHSDITGNTADSGGGLININNEANVTVRNSTISENSVPTYGGGVFGGSGSKLNVTNIINSTIADNEAGDGGGGIYQAGGVLIIDNSTISGNYAGNQSDQGGGGLMQDSDGPITVTNSTITNNTSDANGDGVYHQDFGPIIFRNTIIAANGNKNCEKFPGSGDFVSEGHNLTSDQSCELHTMGDRVGNPNLGPLADNGGPTQTHALMDGSDAIDEGDAKNCPETDQRGYLRPAGGGCDIGAFEVGASEPTPTPAPTPAGTLRTMGDVTCNGPVDSVDALAIQRDQASLPVNQMQPCPGIGDIVDITGASEHPWGDVDCDDDVDTVDSLKILRSVAALPVQQTEPCPDIGTQVTVEE